MEADAATTTTETKAEGTATRAVITTKAGKEATTIKEGKEAMEIKEDTTTKVEREATARLAVHSTTAHITSRTTTATKVLQVSICAPMNRILCTGLMCASVDDDEVVKHAANHSDGAGDSSLFSSAMGFLNNNKVEDEMHRFKNFNTYLAYIT